MDDSYVFYHSKKISNLELLEVILEIATKSKLDYYIVDNLDKSDDTISITLEVPTNNIDTQLNENTSLRPFRMYLWIAQLKGDISLDSILDPTIFITTRYSFLELVFLNNLNSILHGFKYKNQSNVLVPSTLLFYYINKRHDVLIYGTLNEDKDEFLQKNNDSTVEDDKRFNQLIWL